MADLVYALCVSGDADYQLWRVNLNSVSDSLLAHEGTFSQEPSAVVREIRGGLARIGEEFFLAGRIHGVAVFQSAIVFSVNPDTGAQAVVSEDLTVLTGNVAYVSVARKDDSSLWALRRSDPLIGGNKVELFTISIADGSHTLIGRYNNINDVRDIESADGSSISFLGLLGGGWRLCSSGVTADADGSIPYTPSSTAFVGIYASTELSTGIVVKSRRSTVFVDDRIAGDMPDSAYDIASLTSFFTQDVMTPVTPPTPTLSDDDTLSSLTVSVVGGSSVALSPSFSPSTTLYSTTVANDVISVNVEAVPTTNLASAEVVGGSPRILSLGANTIQVIVTAENGDQETYTVVVTRLRETVIGEVQLAALSISPGALTPAFSATEGDYTATVASDVDEVEVVATPPDNFNANIKVFNGDVQIVSENVVDASVTAAVPVPSRNNAIRVVVSNLAITRTTTYYIDITRMPPATDPTQVEITTEETETLLTNPRILLSVSPGALSPDAATDTFGYNYDGDTPQTAVEVSWTVTDDDSFVQIGGVTRSSPFTWNPSSTDPLELKVWRTDNTLSAAYEIRDVTEEPTTPPPPEVEQPETEEEEEDVSGPGDQFAVIVTVPGLPRALLGVSPGSLSPAPNTNRLGYNYDGGIARTNVTVRVQLTANGTARPSNGQPDIADSGQFTWNPQTHSSISVNVYAADGFLAYTYQIRDVTGLDPVPDPPNPLGIRLIIGTFRARAVTERVISATVGLSGVFPGSYNGAWVRIRQNPDGVWRSQRLQYTRGQTSRTVQFGGLIPNTVYDIQASTDAGFIPDHTRKLSIVTPFLRAPESALLPLPEGGVTVALTAEEWTWNPDLSFETDNPLMTSEVVNNRWHRNIRHLFQAMSYGHDEGVSGIPDDGNRYVLEFNLDGTSQYSELEDLRIRRKVYDFSTRKQGAR